MMDSVCCGNFSHSRDGWPPCQKIWCPDCYKCHGVGMYPMTVIRDEAGNKWFKQEEREHRLNHGVAGVHLTIPFQCETCWMRNLEGRDPAPGLDDL